MTSNIGAEEFTDKASQIGFDLNESEEKKILTDYEKTKERIVGSLDDYFALEFINRIDKIVVFSPLDKKSLAKIIKIQLQGLTLRLKKVGVDFSYDTKSVQLIQKETYDPTYGARPVRRYIQDKIEDKIAEMLISDEKHATIQMYAQKGNLQFTSNPASPL